MQLHWIDIGIIVLYLIATIFVGFWVSKRASQSMKHYFLGGNKLPWYMLGVSNASGMFDISGTMWLVYVAAAYGLKGVWLPWLWPTFNQIFLMVYMSAWLRRSNVMTGAEWIQTRFGKGPGSHASHIIVVVFALVSVIGFLAYAAKGIGKFAGEFLPGHLSDDTYAWILMGITTFYVVKGGMFSVVFTEVVQFCILTVASIAIGIIAMVKVAPALLDRVVPAGWHDLFFGWHLNLDWTSIPAINDKIASDGYSLFGIFFMMMLFKGILISAAGPAPNYDMQRVLATKGPREAALMSSTVNVVLFFPRYMMITGLTILALAFYSTDLAAMGKDLDLEKILPLALARFVPVGILGLLMAGLIAAFMSNFAATVNAAPAYLVNDIYKRYINPNASQKRYVWLSYLASFGVVVVGLTFGLFTQSINSIVQWIVSGLWGGYTASNVIKWYWWRFNGWGYFWGMLTGIASSLGLPLVMPHIIPLFQPFVESHFGTEAAQVMVLLGHPITSFPLILVLSLVGCFLGTFLTPAEDEAVLKDFYRRVRPWGFWGPVHAKVVKEDPGFQRNTDFFRDMFNIVIGTIWQTSFIVLAMFLVTRHFRNMLIALAVLVITSIILKFNWYDRLPPPTPDPVAEPLDQSGTTKPAAG
ncbi:MAG TPA: sodium:solute symporter family protein [Candidatus Limnocylindrales bacterium]|nr:sodium:solute symporter family protein [Candidatus Limnocylindrales bacterium]